MELKIKCQCGVKYALDVTPENASTPRQFICQYCGVDSSAAVNEIIKQQFVPVVVPAPNICSPADPGPTKIPLPASIPSEATTTSAPPAAGSRLKVQVGAPITASSSAPDQNVSGPEAQPCLKHPGNFAVEECLVCHKPMCPKCMELFGYVCSAYCQSQAEKAKIVVPVFAGQKALVEAKYWKKVRWASAAAAVFVLALLGAYTWYYFVGSRPAVLYSIKFPASEYGQFAKLMDNDQVILRRAGQISRYDLRADKAIWSAALVDREDLARKAREALAEQNAQLAKWKVRRAQLKATGKLDEDEPNFAEKPRSEEEQLTEITRSVEQGLVSQVHLRVEGHAVWVIGPSKAIQYDWDSGKPIKEVVVPPGLVRVLSGSDKSALLVCQRKEGGELLTRLDLSSGEFKTEQVGGAAEADKEPVKVAARIGAVPAVAPKTSLQVQPGQLGVPLNTKAKLVTAKSLVRRPSGMESMDDPRDADEAFAGGEPGERFEVARLGNSLVFAGENVAELGIKLLQKNFVQYKAFKDKPKVSELDKGVNAANAVTAMSEVMNEIQADQTGGMRTEDESRYLVTIKRLLAAGAPEWSGEVVGPPALFSLKSVDVLTAGKAMYVFDKTNKKLWESKLAYPVGPEMLVDLSWREEAEASHSPCVEREQTLYFFDQGVLTAFDIASGTVRWRLTTVGISAIHFDDKGSMYVSTSSAGAESLKYTKQIDLSKRVVPVIMKVDPGSGKILWKVQKTGSDIYLTGKYLYTMESVPAGGMRIYRLNPSNGEPIWEHYEKRETNNCDFRGTTIQLLYEDQLQVLRFMSL